MQVALATSTPTSTTLVATSTSTAPRVNSSMRSRFSSSPTREWMRASLRSGNTLVRSWSYMPSACLRSTFSDSSIIG